MLTPQGFVTTETHQEPRQKAPPVVEFQPHNLEAEMALLGALVLDPAQFLEVFYLARSDFYLLNNGILYDAMKALFEKHGGYDWLTVVNYLENHDQLEDIGGEVALADLINATPTSYGAAEYAAIIYGHSVRRQTINAGLQIVQSAYDTANDIAPGELVNLSISRLASIDATKNVSRGPQPISNGVEKLLDQMETIERTGKIAGLSTGLKTLDHITGGLKREKLYLLAGRPGMGKSGLALQIAFNVASQGTPVLFYALEMAEEDMTARLVSSVCGVPYESFNRPGIERWEAVINAGEQIRKLPIYFDTTSGYTVQELISVTHKKMMDADIGLVIIDHGGLLNPRKHTGDPFKDQSQVAKEMLGFSKQIDGVPSLCLLQLSRAVESRGKDDHRPKMYDLRNTGDWEQNGDGIWFMYRDEVYNKDTEFPKLGEIGIEKNRGGKTGSLSIYADVKLNRFTDLEIRTERL